MSAPDPLDLLLVNEPLQPSRVLEPPMSRGDKSDPTNPYEGRWRWWYSAIADYMIRNPGGTIAECAREIKRSPTTISMIVHTDLFQSYLQQRKSEWAREHDYALRAKLTGVALKGLDLIDQLLDTKGDQVPLQRLAALTESSLDRLGYAPKSSPVVVIDQSQHDNRQQTLNVSSSVLQEAREKMRLVEEQKAGQSLSGPAMTPPPVLEVTEAEPVQVSDTDLLKE